MSYFPEFEDIGACLRPTHRGGMAVGGSWPNSQRRLTEENNPEPVNLYRMVVLYSEP